MTDISADTVTAPATTWVASPTPRTMSARVVDSVYNLNDYGAAGDGLTDDTTAMTNALYYAAANPGTIVYLPSATYLFNSVTSQGLPVPSNTTIRGAGQNRTVVRWNDTSGSPLFFTGYNSTFNKIIFEHFTVQGNWQSEQNALGGFPFLIYFVTGLILRHVTSQYVCSMGIAARSCVDVEVYNCIVSCAASDGISLTSCAGISVTDNVVEHTEDDGISAHSDVGEPWGVRKNIVISGNRLFDTQGIKVLSARNCTIASNQLDCVRAQGITIVTVAASDSGTSNEGVSAALGVVISGNTITNCIQRTDVDDENESAPGIFLSGVSARGASTSGVGVLSVYLASPGSGGTNGGPYNLTFSGGGGSGAAGTFSVVNGSVYAPSIDITAPGMSYTSPPSLSFAAGGLTNAIGTPILSGISTIPLLEVASIFVSSTGSGGTNGGPYALAFTGGGGTGAAGTFSVAGGSVSTSSITITASGSSYTSPPLVSFSAGGVTNAVADVVMQGTPGPLGNGIPGEVYTVGSTQTGVTDPYPWMFQNSVLAGAPTTGSFGISIVGNTIKRTLPACNGTAFNPTTGVAYSKFSDYGFGEMFTKHGWVNPPLKESDLRDNAVEIAGGVIRDVLIAGNVFSGMLSGLAINGSAGDRCDNIVFRENVVTDCYNWGVLLNTSATVRAYIYSNLFDLDPYFKHPNRGSNGTWLTNGYPAALWVQSGSGVTFRGNTIRNCSSDSNIATDTPNFSNWLDSNIVEADPSAVGFSTSNRGVGYLRSSGNSLMVQSGNNPTASNFGQMLTPPPSSAASCPITGTYLAGHFVRNSAPSKLGTPIASVTIAAAGSHGTAGSFALVFSGGGGSGAAGTFTVSPGGSVTALTVTNPGTGYTSPPSISLSASSGLTGASVTCSAGRILFGWLRLTTGSGNTLNTDWSPLYPNIS